MNERKICCCGASTWAIVIAWLQIAGNALTFIFLGIALTFVIIRGPDEFVRAASGSLFNSSGDSIYAISLTFTALSIMVSGIAIVMGVILLHGSNERATRYLCWWWIIYSSMCMFWEAISAIFHTTESLAVSLPRFILVLVMYSFGIWVVRIHAQETGSQSVPEVDEGQPLLIERGA